MCSVSRDGSLTAYVIADGAVFTDLTDSDVYATCADWSPPPDSVYQIWWHSGEWQSATCLEFGKTNLEFAFLRPENAHKIDVRLLRPTG